MTAEESRIAAGRLPPRVREFLSRRIHRGWEWIVALGAVGPDDPHGQRFRSMGPRSMIAFPPGGVFGHRWITIGTDTLIGPQVSMSVGFWNEERDPDAPVVIRIGARVNIGRLSSLVGRVGIEIGDDTTFGPNVYVTDHNHSYDDPEVPVSHQWPRSAAVRIGSGCWIGTGAIVLPGTTIGDHVTVAGGSVVRGDIPDRCVVAGVPATIVRRWTDDGWDPPLDERDDHVPAEWVDSPVGHAQQAPPSPRASHPGNDL